MRYHKARGGATANQTRRQSDVPLRPKMRTGTLGGGRASGRRGGTRPDGEFLTKKEQRRNSKTSTQAKRTSPERWGMGLLNGPARCEGQRRSTARGQKQKSSKEIEAVLASQNKGDRGRMKRERSIKASTQRRIRLEVKIIADCKIG